MGGLHAGPIAAVTLVVAVAGVAASIWWRAHHVPARTARWPHTMGTVLSSTLQVSRAGAVRVENPLVYYAYQVNGQVFQGRRVRAAGAPPDGSSTVARYPAGASVIVYYDPDDPSISALEL
jgi:hypothetical protein